MTVSIKHATLTGAAADSTALVDGPAWDAAHTITGLTFTDVSGSVSASQMPALTGDITTPAGDVVTTLATVNSNVGVFGSATQSVQFTVNGKGLMTAAANVTVTPAIGSITGLGTGVATALAVNTGSAGAPVLFNGAGGTPSSMTATNLSGTAASLTAGNVTTNANLTGPITSVGNATSAAASLFASPSASIGLAAVNGSATTAMRSDGAPALSVSISPTWTGDHAFTKSINGSYGPVVTNSNAGSSAIAHFALISDAGSFDFRVNSTAASGRVDQIWNGTANMFFWNNNASPGNFVWGFTSAPLTPMTLSQTSLALTHTTSGTSTTAASFTAKSIGLTENAYIGGGTYLSAGTASVAPINLTSGTNLTSAVAGALEYDGVQLYGTTDTTGGRAAIPVEQYFHLTAAGSTISTIANFFGSTSNISLVASGYYEIEIVCYFLKTTSDTIVWTLTNSAAPTGQNIHFEMSPISGIVAPPGTATMLTGQYYNDATAARAFTTGTLTTAVNHYARFKIFLKNGTGTSLKIQATSTSGTITPGINSWWRCVRRSPNNIGTFAA